MDAKVAFSVCTTCHMVPPSDRLKGHQQREHKIYECELCGDTSTSEYGLNDRRQREHVMCECDHCGEMIESSGQLFSFTLCVYRSQFAILLPFGANYAEVQLFDELGMLEAMQSFGQPISDYFIGSHVF